MSPQMVCGTTQFTCCQEPRLRENDGGSGVAGCGISWLKNSYCCSQGHQGLSSCQVSFPFLFTFSAAFDIVFPLS